jgi:hypothetical protein
VFLHLKTQQNKKNRGKTDIEIFVDFLRIFSEKVFDMDFLHFLNRAFELPLLRNARKRTKKKVQELFYFGVGWFLEVNQTYVEVRQFCILFLSAPRVYCYCQLPSCHCHLQGYR